MLLDRLKRCEKIISWQNAVYIIYNLFQKQNNIIELYGNKQQRYITDYENVKAVTNALEDFLKLVSTDFFQPTISCWYQWTKPNYLSPLS